MRRSFMADFVQKSFWGGGRKFLEPLMRHPTLTRTRLARVTSRTYSEG